MWLTWPNRKLKYIKEKVIIAHYSALCAIMPWLKKITSKAKKLITNTTKLLVFLKCMMRCRVKFTLIKRHPGGVVVTTLCWRAGRVWSQHQSWFRLLFSGSYFCWWQQEGLAWGWGVGGGLLVTAHSQTYTREPGRSYGRWVRPRPVWAPRWGLLSLHGFHPELDEVSGWRPACWIHHCRLSGPAGCTVGHDAAWDWEGDRC